MKIKTGLMLFLALLLGAKAGFSVPNKAPNFVEVPDDTTYTVYAQPQKLNKKISAGMLSEFYKGGASIFPWAQYSQKFDDGSGSFSILLPLGYSYKKSGFGNSEIERWQVGPLFEIAKDNVSASCSFDGGQSSYPYSISRSLENILSSFTDSSYNRQIIRENGISLGQNNQGNYFVGGSLGAIFNTINITGAYSLNVNNMTNTEITQLRNQNIYYDSSSTTQTVPITQILNYITTTDVSDTTNFNSQNKSTKISLDIARNGMKLNKTPWIVDADIYTVLAFNKLATTTTSNQWIRSQTSGNALVIVNGDSTLIPVYSNSTNHANYGPSEVSSKDVHFGTALTGAASYFGNRGKITLEKSVASKNAIGGGKFNLTGMIYHPKDWSASVGDISFEFGPKYFSATAEAWTNFDYPWVPEILRKNHQQIRDAIKNRNDDYDAINYSIVFSPEQKEIKKQVVDDNFAGDLPNCTIGYALSVFSQDNKTGVSATLGAKIADIYNYGKLSISNGKLSPGLGCNAQINERNSISGYLEYNGENLSTTFNAAYSHNFR